MLPNTINTSIYAMLVVTPNSIPVPIPAPTHDNRMTMSPVFLPASRVRNKPPSIILPSNCTNHPHPTGVNESPFHDNHHSLLPDHRLHRRTTAPAATTRVVTMAHPPPSTPTSITTLLVTTTSSPTVFRRRPNTSSLTYPPTMVTKAHRASSSSRWPTSTCTIIMKLAIG